MSITVRRVTNVEQDGKTQLVYVSGDLSRYLTSDYMRFETGTLVFEIPAGIKLPEHVTRLGNISKQVIENVTHEDVLINVRSLYPVNPYKPNAVKPKKSMEFIMDRTEYDGVTYMQLLGAEEAGEVSGAQTQDHFDIDKEEKTPSYLKQMLPYVEPGTVQEDNEEDLLAFENKKLIEDMNHPENDSVNPFFPVEETDLSIEFVNKDVVEPFFKGEVTDVKVSEAVSVIESFLSKEAKDED
jgi:hypothetical protein